MAVVDHSSSSLSFRDLEDVFLQSQARIWIGEVLHTRLDEQLSICDLLSDGELLFEVSKTLWNMLSKKYMELMARMFVSVDTRKGSGRYRPYSNVDSFLKVCKVMGLNGVDLFSPSDVVEKRNTRKVCVCIRSLSTKARSKQLNVPDFDIVTNTVAMSTDVVRCIRRSLELSSMSSVTSGQSKHATRQKTSSASNKQEDESCLEESDEAKSHFSDGSNVDFLYLESESPDTVDKYALTQSIRHSDASIDKYARTPTSVLLQYVNSESHLESGLMICDEYTSIDHGGQFLLDNENSQNVREVSHHISVSDISLRILTNATFHVSKDCLCHSCMATESHSSNTTPDSSISRVWRKLPDDVEASPTSSVLGRVLDFDFDFDAKSEPDDVTSLESSTYDNMSGLCNQSELQVLELSSDSFSPWWDDATNIADTMQENVAGKGSSDKLMKSADPNMDAIFNEQGAVKFSERCDCCAEDTSRASSKDERTYDSLAKADTDEKKEKRTEKKPSYMAPLLKTVAKGTALIGILFFLHLRIRSDTTTQTGKSIEIRWKSNEAPSSKRKEEKGGKIYPVEKFKFDD